MKEHTQVPDADARRGAADDARRSGCRTSAAAAAAAGDAAAVAPADGGRAALDDPRRRGDPPPLRRLQPVLRAGARAVDDLHLRLLPAAEDATLEEAQAFKYDLVARKLDLQPGQRLLDVGCGWGGMVRHAAREYGVRRSA